tara:strand:+ start:1418 stop:1564 length:147 start_codon:yes stop_codon:yes gene_type:complete
MTLTNGYLEHEDGLFEDGGARIEYSKVLEDIVSRLDMTSLQVSTHLFG